MLSRETGHDAGRDDATAQARIERLFEESRTDPRKTLELKDELDARGLWAEYRERFVELVTGDPWF